MLMDKDYLDFVKRMGSFEEELDVETEDEPLIHAGRKGMKWGKHIFGKIKDIIDPIPQTEYSYSRSLVKELTAASSKEEGFAKINDYLKGSKIIMEFNDIQSDVNKGKNIDAKLKAFSDKYSTEDYNIEEMYRAEQNNQKIKTRIVELEEKIDELRNIYDALESMNDDSQRNNMHKILGKLTDLLEEIDNLNSQKVVTHSTFGLGVEDIELKHFGILGMKWGVRKDDSPTMARAKALVANKAALSDMANNELQNLVTKLNLERQLNDIVGKYEADNPSIMKSVRGVIGNIAGKGVKMAAEAAQKQVVNYINDKINAGKPDPLKKITDADLIKATTRLSLENRFRELMKKRG